MPALDADEGSRSALRQWPVHRDRRRGASNRCISADANAGGEFGAAMGPMRIDAKEVGSVKSILICRRDQSGGSERNSGTVCNLDSDASPNIKTEVQMINWVNITFLTYLPMLSR